MAPAALSSSAGAGEHEFIGSKKCKTCHMKQYKSWEKTTMSQAFELLKPGVRAEAKQAADLDPEKDYTSDADCLRCHVTGLGEAGGFVDAATSPTLAGVGCETCHGAGSTYTKKEHMSLKNKKYKKADIVAAGMVDQVGEQLCVGCHNSDSPFFEGFDFEKQKDEGTHEHFPLKYEH